jgi:alpha-N-acetylgalactosaminidase
MGWLSWERFGCNLDCASHPSTCISERLYVEQADMMVQGGYRDAGYVYVNVDDCWSERDRDDSGNLVPDQRRFPRGMLWLARYLHALDLKFGLYGDIGTMTCAGYPGFQDHMEQDAQTLADWQVDSIKVDGCNADPAIFNQSYPAFGVALNRTGRPVLYNCQWPLYQSSSKHGEDPDLLNTQIKRTCNQWRNYYDVFDSWVAVRSIINYWSRPSGDDVLVRAGGPGHWNDPDMLVVGNPGLSLSEQQAQFALWCIFAAPLLISADLRSVSEASREILLNQEAIAVNQDPLGRQGYCPEGADSPHRVYVRELLPSSLQPCPRGTSDTWAVVLANFQSIFAEAPLTFDPSVHLPDRGEAHRSRSLYHVRDLLRHEDLGNWSGPFTVDVDESSVRMFKVTLHDAAPSARTASEA